MVAQKPPKLDHACRACRLGRFHKLPASGQFERTSRVGQTIYSDIVGKLEMSYPGLYRYVCTFLDDHAC